MKKKIIALIILLFQLLQTTFAQVETKIFMPNFQLLENKLNDTALIDFVKHDKNIIFYKFERNDTINEFFFVNDTIFKFREIINNKINKNGQFKFIPSKIDTSYHYPPGQYEEETTYLINGKLLRTGWWNENYYKLSGSYQLDKRQGTWNMTENNEKVKIEYDEDGKIFHILNPTDTQIEKYSNWLQNSDFKLCTEKESYNTLKNWVEIVKGNCKCYTRNSVKYFNFKHKSEKKEDEKTVYWKVNKDRTISLILYNKTGIYKIWSLGKERIKLSKVIDDDLLKNE